MLDPWIIEEIRRREQEERRRQDERERPFLEIPHDAPTPPQSGPMLPSHGQHPGSSEEEDPNRQKDEDEDSERGVVIVDFSVG